MIHLPGALDWVSVSGVAGCVLVSAVLGNGEFCDPVLGV